MREDFFNDCFLEGNASVEEVSLLRSTPLYFRLIQIALNTPFRRLFKLCIVNFNGGKLTVRRNQLIEILPVLLHDFFQIFMVKSKCFRFIKVWIDEPNKFVPILKYHTLCLW